MNFTGEVTKKEVCIRQGNVSNIESEEAFERTLKFLDSGANFDRDLFNKGQMWFESGLTLEDAPEHFRINRNFVRGFERGKRIAYIQELQLNKKSK